MKKIGSIFMVLVLCIGVVGCESNKGKSNDGSTNKVDKYEIKTVEMSEEETKELTEGQHIEKIDDKTLKVPNREVLEEMGLDYGIVIGTTLTYEDGSQKDSGIKSSYYEKEYVDLAPYEFTDDNKNKVIGKDYIVGINIIPIIAAYKDDVNGNIYKSVQMIDYVYNPEMINPDNLEMLQQMISAKYGN